LEGEIFQKSKKTIRSPEIREREQMKEWDKILRKKLENEAEYEAIFGGYKKRN